MKAILMSDRPKWCALMMNEQKKVEVRKGTALYKAIQKLIDENGFADIYVYCCKGDLLHGNKFDGYFVEDKKFKKECEKYGANIPNYYNGKVIFKFRCYKVEEMFTKEYGGSYYTNTIKEDYKVSKMACIDDDDITEYLNGNDGCAIHISDLEIFDKPKELSEFRKVNKAGIPQYEFGVGTCDYKRIAKAPQSYMFIEVGE